MGEFAQKRIIRKLDLELFLSKVAIQPSPQVELEQYTLSEQVASQMLYIAAYNNCDIVGKSILDLGCGTGRLALGASYLGAKEVLGIDIDKIAIQTAARNAHEADISGHVQWVLGDIGSITGKFDTVLQNPPFGVHRRKADRAFLLRALELGNSIYSLHNHPEVDKHLINCLKESGGFAEVSSSPFLAKLILKHGGEVTAVYAFLMSIPKMFDFHTKLRHDFVIDLYIIRKKHL